MIQRIGNLLLRNNSAKQTIAKNLFWLTVSQIGSRLIRAGLIIYAARLLGVAEYGLFSYVLGLAGFFTIFADISLSPILTREAAKKPTERTKYFATILWLKIGLLALTAVLIIFAAPYLSKIEGASSLLWLVALLTTFDGLRDFAIAFFRSFEKMEWEGFVNLFTNIAITTIGGLILLNSPTARGLFIGYIVATGLGTLVAFFMIRGYLRQIFSSFDKTVLKSILISALPMAAIGMLGAFMVNVDLVMLGWLKTANEVGWYSAGQKIIMVLYTIPAIFAVAIFPALARAAENRDKETAKKILEKALTMSLLLAIPIAAGGLILAEPIINFLYGAEYLPSVIAFQILLIPLLIIFPGQTIGNFIVANDQQKKAAGYAAAASVGNVILCYLLIPKFGIAGAAVATLTAQIFYNAMAWRLSRRITDFSVFRGLKKIIVGGLAMVPVAFLLNQLELNILATISLSGIFYFGFLLLIKETAVSEAKNLLQKLRSPQNPPTTTP